MKIEYIKDYKNFNDKDYITVKKNIDINKTEIKELQKEINESNSQVVHIFYHYDNKLECKILWNIIKNLSYNNQDTVIPPTKENEYYNSYLTIYKK